MAENEKKTTEKTVDQAPKKAAKPSFFKRAGAWLKTVRSECKKVTWANWESVRQNSIVVIVVTVIFAVVLGILDYAFSNAIVGLSRVL